MPTREQVYNHPLFQAFDPRGKEFLEARRIPFPLNPYEYLGIEIFALVLTKFPHLKAIPVFQMMLEDFEAGLYEGMHTIVVPSSGNTAHAVGRLAPVFGFRTTKVVLPSDIPSAKKNLLDAMASVDVLSLGGGKSPAEYAKEEAQKPGHCYLDQYGHLGNVRAHDLYTGPEIARALAGNIGAIAIPFGSAGTITGVGQFLKREYHETIVIGVRPLQGESVPGARNEKKMEEVVTFPWQKVTDKVVEVSRHVSFIKMREMWSVVEPQPGPTSGLAWAGLMHYLARPDTNREQLGEKKKKVAFLCMDDGRFYSDPIIAQLNTDQGLSHGS